MVGGNVSNRWVSGEYSKEAMGRRELGSAVPKRADHFVEGEGHRGDG